MNKNLTLFFVKGFSNYISYSFNPSTPPLGYSIIHEVCTGTIWCGFAYSSNSMICIRVFRFSHLLLYWTYYINDNYYFIPSCCSNFCIQLCLQFFFFYIRWKKAKKVSVRYIKCVQHGGCCVLVAVSNIQTTTSHQICCSSFVLWPVVCTRCSMWKCFSYVSWELDLPSNAELHWLLWAVITAHAAHLVSFSVMWKLCFQ